MTIAAGFTFSDGVMLCADSQMTIGNAKLNGMKVGRMESKWGQVACAFAGNVDWASAAFQACERAKDSREVKKSPVDGIGGILEDFYRRQVFGHPRYESGDYDYSLFVAIRLDGDARAKLYRAEQTIFREVKSFDCAGSGEDYGREILQFLHFPTMKRERAVALASYMLTHAKKNAQYCGGESVILALLNTGNLDRLETMDITELGNHIEATAAWFVVEAQQFVLGHAVGDRQAFDERWEILKTRALRIRTAWESRPSMQLDPRWTKPDEILLPPWPELREAFDES